LSQRCREDCTASARNGSTTPQPPRRRPPPAPSLGPSRRRCRLSSAPAPRGAPRRSSAPLAVQCAQLGELALEQRAKSRHVGLELALDVGALPLDLALSGARLFEDAPRLGLRLPPDDLGLALGRPAGLLAQLLRRDERLVHGALALSIHGHLLSERRQPPLEPRLL